MNFVYVLSHGWDHEGQAVEAVFDSLTTAQNYVPGLTWKEPVGSYQAWEARVPSSPFEYYLIETFRVE